MVSCWEWQTCIETRPVSNTIYYKNHLSWTQTPDTEANTRGTRWKKTLKKRQKKDCHTKTLEDEDIAQGHWPFYSAITVRDERWWWTTTKAVTAPGETGDTKINKATCRWRYESPGWDQNWPVSFVSSRPSQASLQRMIRIPEKHGNRGRKGNVGVF